MANGWIKLHRKVLDNDIFRFDKTAWNLFELLLLLADQKGVVITGRKRLALQMGNNENTVYKALKRLSVTGMITLASNNQFTIISICKWDEYQGSGNNQSNTSSNNQVTTQQQPSNTIYKNKEVIKKNIDTPEALEVFDFFVTATKRNPKTFKPSEIRLKLIVSRLKDYSIVDIKKAITNYVANGWHLENGFIDLVYAIGQQKGKPDNLEKWLTWEPGANQPQKEEAWDL